MAGKKTGWDWWCTRAWIKFGLLITAGVTVWILANFTSWPYELMVVAAVAALVPVHVVEEWVFPGGFHFQYNTFLWKSDEVDRYPMCRLSDMYTNLIATFFYLALALWCALANGCQVPTGVIMGTIGFSILELVLHTFFGTQAWLRFRKDGKTTIYGPGSITAYLGFGVLGAILCWAMVGRAIMPVDWAVCAGVLAVIGLGCVLGPETIIKRHGNRYFFESAGYFERFL
jgi:hypothetical protein